MLKSALTDDGNAKKHVPTDVRMPIVQDVVKENGAARILMLKFAREKYGNAWKPVLTDVSTAAALPDAPDRIIVRIQRLQCSA
jgi:hypothetical protein